MRQGQKVLDLLGIQLPQFSDQSNEAVVWRVLQVVAERLIALEAETVQK